MIQSRSKNKKSNFPTKQEIVFTIEHELKHPNVAELTRHFSVKGAQKKKFLAMLKSLQKSKYIDRDGLKYLRTTRPFGDGKPVFPDDFPAALKSHPASWDIADETPKPPSTMKKPKTKSRNLKYNLPAVAVLNILPDCDPDALVAIPDNWNEDDGKPPHVTIDVKPGDRTVPGPGDRILARISKDKKTYAARPMKILVKPRRAQIGIIKLDKEGARLLPVDRKQKEMRIATQDLNNAIDGDLVEVEVRSKGRMMIPLAKVVAIVGNPMSEGAVSLIALHNLEIPYRFPSEVIRAADTAKLVAIKSRQDWRDLPFITIDPASAKDHDDAVFAAPDTDKNNKDGHVVYVAIADVAAYISPGSILDKEAYLRGNSVYFPDRVVPMLPEKISNNLCSLRENENRPALAVRMVLNKSGQKTSHTFHRVTINIAAGLSYQQAQAAFDGHPTGTAKDLNSEVLQPLWNAYQSMVKAREKRGPLDLDLPERKIVLNNQGQVDRVYVPERAEANRLIEEMMVAANVCAAQTLEQKNTPLIYRVHDQPGEEKLQALKDFLSSLEMSFTSSGGIKPNQFNAILRKAKDTDKSIQVSEMVLRSQAQAEYNPVNYGHFGLNLGQYAHFTSPIRRYADLIVHRALISACGLGKDGQSTTEAEKLVTTAQHISMTERRAMAAERQTTDRLISQYLSHQIGAEFPGQISGVVGAGLFVKLTETGADGFVPAATLGQDYFRHVPEQQAMIGERTGERFRLGDQVLVKLIEAAPMAGAMRFELLSEGEKTTPLQGRKNFRSNRTGNRAGQRGRTGNKRSFSKGKRRKP